MRFVPGLIIAFLSIIFSAEGQAVSDDDKRGFDELTPIFIDVDNDGKSDRIQPRTYQTRHKPHGKRLLEIHIKNWITFDLKTSTGKTVRSFFTYNYGTAEQGGSYWVYALTATEDVNKDGRRDLMFYTGDDTGDDTVILLNKGNRFPVHSRKKDDSGDWVKDIQLKP